MKLIMPMAGVGSRFGPGVTKPLVDVSGVPMFVYSERCIGIDFSERIFITRVEHDLRDVIQSYYPGSTVIEIDYVTQGTAESILLAREHYEDGSDIFVSNCDQAVSWDSSFAQALMTVSDGLIATFDAPDQDPKWSYALSTPSGRVTRVAEKVAISRTATVGYYYWRDGRDYIAAAEHMIADNVRVNGEFYTCPVYNYNIAHGENIQTIGVESMHGLGTPEDLKLWQNL